MIFLLATLAVWRATFMIVEEEGPLGAFQRLRDSVDPYQKTWLGRGLNCFWCVSFWIGAACAGWMWYFGLIELATFPLWWGALSSGAILIRLGVDELRRRRK